LGAGHTWQALKTELGDVAYAVALGTAGGAILVRDEFWQKIILAFGLLVVLVLICVKIRSKI